MLASIWLLSGKIVLLHLNLIRCAVICGSGLYGVVGLLLVRAC